MTESVTTITSAADSAEAGAELGRAIRKGFNEAAADASGGHPAQRHRSHHEND